jgi:hypothetical protein
MRVDIKNDNQNWLNWGNLVQIWIDNDKMRPTTIRALKDQLTEYSVVAAVDGADGREVLVYVYSDSASAPLMIAIPSPTMRNAKLGMVTAGPYPYTVMPSFYDIAYGGAARVNLSTQESRDFAVRRIGEYSVNECC